MRAPLLHESEKELGAGSRVVGVRRLASGYFEVRAEDIDTNCEDEQLDRSPWSARETGWTRTGTDDTDDTDGHGWTRIGKT